MFVCLSGRFACGTKKPNIADFALWADYTYLLRVFKMRPIFENEKYEKLVPRLLLVF